MDATAVNYITQGQLWGKTWRRRFTGKLLRLLHWRDHRVAINLETRTLELFEHKRQGGSSLEGCVVIKLNLDTCVIDEIQKKKAGKDFAFVVTDGREHVLFAADTESDKDKV